MVQNLCAGSHFNCSFGFDGPDCSSYVLSMLSCAILVLDHSLFRNTESGIQCYLWDSSMITFLLCFCCPSGWDLLFLVIKWAGGGSSMLHRFHLCSKTQLDVMFQVLLPPALCPSAWWIWVTGRVSCGGALMLDRSHCTVHALGKGMSGVSSGGLMPSGWHFGRIVFWFFPLSCNSFAKHPLPC